MLQFLFFIFFSLCYNSYTYILLKCVFFFVYFFEILKTDPIKFDLLKKNIEDLDATKRQLEKMSDSQSQNETDAPKFNPIAPKYIQQAKSFMVADLYLKTSIAKLIKKLEATYLKELGRNVTMDDLNVVDIDVVHWKNLSMRKFMRKYATHSLPVVIRGLPITRTPWTFEHLKKKCGNETALLKKR